VGTSNLLRDDVARAVIGRNGMFTVRPEKIRIGDPAEQPAEDEYSALGEVREVVYLGSDTRYIVSLDAGGELVVTEQNLQTSSMEALAAQGKAVRLTWKRQHVLSLAESQEAEGDQEGVEDK
jgi:putative spermidine/putrescine transport system ATP-binding protein